MSFVLLKLVATLLLIPRTWVEVSAEKKGLAAALEYLDNYKLPELDHLQPSGSSNKYHVSATQPSPNTGNSNQQSPTQFRYYDTDQGTPSEFNQRTAQKTPPNWPQFTKPEFYKGPNRDKGKATGIRNSYPPAGTRYADGTSGPAIYFQPYSPAPLKPNSAAVLPHNAQEYGNTPNVQQNMHQNPGHNNAPRVASNQQYPVPPPPQSQPLYASNPRPQTYYAPVAPVRYAEHASPPLTPQMSYTPQPSQGSSQGPPVYSLPIAALALAAGYANPPPKPYQPQPMQYRGPITPIDREPRAYSETHESYSSPIAQANFARPAGGFHRQNTEYYSDLSPREITTAADEPQMDEPPKSSENLNQPEVQESASFRTYTSPGYGYSNNRSPQQFTIPILPKSNYVSSPKLASDAYYTHSTYASPYKNYAYIEYFKHSITPATTSYDVEFKASNGIYQQEHGHLKTLPGYSDGSGGSSQPRVANVKTGTVSWTSPEGIPFTMSYIADENGFRPVGPHLTPSGVHQIANHPHNIAYASTNYETLPSASEDNPTVIVPDSPSPSSVAS